VGWRRDCITSPAAPFPVEDARRPARNEREMTVTVHYRIIVECALDDSWSAWFDGLTIAHDASGDTTLAGAVRDQTALYGLIAKLRDLGLTLIAVERGATATDVGPLMPL
jgi:hypothetical protein